MRALIFEPESSSYERIYACLVTSPLQLRDRGQQKLHGLILDKLEAIGQVKPAVNLQTGEIRPHLTDELRFWITVSGGAVVLENEEWAMVKEHCESCVPLLHKSLSRSLEKTLMWLETLPIDPTVTPVAPPAP